MPAQRIHAAAGHADIAQQQLDHRRAADDLRAAGVVRPAERVKPGQRLVLRRARADDFGDLQEVGPLDAGDLLDLLGRVA
ncbi:hypothetical protein D9M72_330590 [compost metagenome]